MYSTKVLRMIEHVRDTIGDSENRSESIIIQCKSTAVTSAELTISYGIDGEPDLVISTNSESYLISEDLEDYSTVYDLVDELSNNSWIDVSLYGESDSRSNGSIDPYDFAPVNGKDILRNSYAIRTRHWFSDRKIYRWLCDACERRLPDYSPENVLDDDELYLALNAALHGVVLLMADAAKYYPTNIDGFSASKGSLVTNYQVLYNTVEDRIAMMGVPLQVGHMLTQSRITGGPVKTSRYTVPIPVKLISATSSESTVTLTWSQSILTEFYCYEVWQYSSGSWSLVTSITERLTLDYDVENLDAGTYSFKIRTVVQLSVPTTNQYPSTVPSDYRKYADSKEIEVVVSGG
jgi:hypothetical protein